MSIRTLKRQKERYDNELVFMTRKEKHQLKLDTTREIVNKVSDMLNGLLTTSLKSSFEWFNDKQYGDKRVEKVITIFDKELNKNY